METKADKKNYCLVCGAVEDAEGTCTNEKCVRRKVQLKIKDLKDKTKS